MKIDVAKVKERMRKLEALLELAQDPEMDEFILDKSPSTNGHAKRNHAAQPSNGNGNSREKQPRGGLLEVIQRTCLEMPGKFTVPGIIERLHERGYEFAAKDAQVSTYSALRRLKDKGIVNVVEEGGPSHPAKWAVTAGQKAMKLDI